MSDASQSQLILYRTPDGQTRIQCRFENENVWLTQALMAELFQKDVRTINEHLVNIYEESELKRDATIRKFRIVRREGSREVAREVEHYNLEAIISVGYRVKSQCGTQFRQWATARLKEYLVKGFTMDDERLKNPPGKGHKDYFDELLERIRDVRSSERRFYQKVLEIYATSVDYDPTAEASQQFFATVQNKMHWATHGRTAAELIHERADAKKPFMGMLTTRPGAQVRKEDAAVAKNYPTEDELKVLNRIVSLYLDYAELQALERRPMTMQDWIAKLDDFLKASGRELLNHAGTVSHEQALQKAELEYEKFRQRELAAPSQVEKDFEKVIKHLPPPPKPKKKRGKK